MAIEAIRGCGYRKVGGLYLCGSSIIITTCDRLPYNLPEACPTCGAGIKPHRGFQWMNPLRFFGVHIDCEDKPICPMCRPPNDLSGLMWVGNRFYSPQSFIAEAINQGFSKRIAHIPRGLIIGKTIVYLAHRKAGTTTTEEETLLGKVKQNQSCPAIFYVFRPTRIEKLIWKSEATTDTILDLEKQGITPIIIPDGDKDHDPSTPMSQDIKEARKPKYKRLEDVI